MNSKILSMLVTTSVCVTALFIQPVDAGRGRGLEFGSTPFGGPGSSAGSACMYCTTGGSPTPGTHEGPIAGQDCWELVSDTCTYGQPSLEQTNNGDPSNPTVVSRVTCNQWCNQADQGNATLGEDEASQICFTVSAAIAVALKASGFVTVEGTVGMSVQTCKTLSKFTQISVDYSCTADERKTLTLYKISQSIKMDLSIPIFTKQKWIRNLSPECPTPGGVAQQELEIQGLCENVVDSSTGSINTYFLRTEVEDCLEGQDGFIERYYRLKDEE